MSASDSVSPPLARVRRNTLFLMVSNVGGAGLSFVLAALIGRSLGDYGLGVYAVCMAWVYPSSMLVEFGMGTLMTRDLATNATHADEVLAAVSLERLIAGGLAMLALFIAAPLLSDDPQVITGLRISTPMIMLLPFYSGYTAVFRAREAMGSIPLLNIGMLAAQVIFTVAALLLNTGIYGVLIANVASSALQVGAAGIIYRARFADRQTMIVWGEAVKQILPLARQAWHFALAALFVALQVRLSAILLDTLATTQSAGTFAAANRFLEAAKMTPNAFFGAVFPALAGLAADRVNLRRTFTRVMMGLALFGVGAGIAFTLAADLLIRLVYGENFADARLVLVLLGWSLMFNLLRGGRTLYWYAVGREGMVNAVNGVVIVLQVGVSVWAIPAYGAAGAAAVQIIVEAAALIALWIPKGRST